MAATTELGIRLTLDGGKVVSAAIADVNDSLDGMGRAARSASGGFEVLQGAMAGIVTIGGAMQLLKVADSVTTLQTALKLSSNSANEAKSAFEGVFAIAQRTRVTFTELGQTYAAIARSGNELGISQQRMLKVTESVAAAMTISGGSAESMKAALVQLGQGLSSGTLRGEELNSVMEQTPRLAKAIAEGMGVSIGQLRALGEQGKLTGEAVIQALEKAGPQLMREIDSATLTVSQSLTVLQNSFTKFIGEADAASKTTETVASAIKGLAGMLDTLGESARNNQGVTAFLTSLAAGAAGLGGTAAAVWGLTAAVTALGVAARANPIILTLSLIGGATMAVKSAVDSYEKSATGLQAKLDKLKETETSIARYQNLLKNNKDNPDAWRWADQIKDMQGQLPRLTKEANEASAALGKLRADNITGSVPNPDRLLADAQKKETIAGTKALDEVRKHAKLRTDIIAEYQEKEKTMRASFTQAQNKAETEAARNSLVAEEKDRLDALNDAKRKALKSFDDAAAKPGKDAAKSASKAASTEAKERLSAIVSGLELERQAAEDIGKEKLRDLESLHKQGLESEFEYITQKSQIAQDANIDQQAVLELELEAVQRSGIAKEQRLAQEARLNADLQKLSAEYQAIKQNEVNAIAEMDSKLDQAADKQNQTLTASVDTYIAELQRKQAADKALSDAKAQMAGQPAEIIAGMQAEMAVHAQAQKTIDDLTKTYTKAAKAASDYAQDMADVQDLLKLSPQEQQQMERTYARLAKTMQTAKDALERTSDATNTAGIAARVNATAESLKQQTDKLAADINTKLVDGIMSAGKDGGAGLVKAIEDALINRPFRIVVEAMVQPVSSAIAQGIMGQSIGGVAGATGFQTAMNTASLAVSNFGSTLIGTAANVATGGATLAQTWAAGSAMMNTAGGTMTGIAMKIGAAAPYIAAAAVAANSLSNAIERANGSVTAAGIFAYGRNSVDGFKTGGRADFIQVGGGGTTPNSSWFDPGEETSKYMSAMGDLVTKSVKGWADAIGLSADAVNGYTETVQAAIGNGMSKAEERQSIDKAMAGYGDAMVQALFGQIMAFANRGETPSGTLERLGNDVTAVNNILRDNGKALYDTSFESAKAVQVLINSVGGLDKFKELAGTLETVNSVMMKLGKSTFELSMDGAKAANDLAKSVGGTAKLSELADGLIHVNENLAKLGEPLLDISVASARTAHTMLTATDNAVKALEAAERLEASYASFVSNLSNADTSSVSSLQAAFNRALAAVTVSIPTIKGVADLTGVTQDQYSSYNDPQRAKLDAAASAYKNLNNAIDAAAKTAESAAKTAKDAADAAVKAYSDALKAIEKDTRNVNRELADFGKTDFQKKLAKIGYDSQDKLAELDELSAKAAELSAVATGASLSATEATLGAVSTMTGSLIAASQDLSADAQEVATNVQDALGNSVAAFGDALELVPAIASLFDEILKGLRLIPPALTLVSNAVTGVGTASSQASGGLTTFGADVGMSGAAAAAASGPVTSVGTAFNSVAPGAAAAGAALNALGAAFDTASTALNGLAGTFNAASAAVDGLNAAFASAATGLGSLTSAITSTASAGASLAGSFGSISGALSDISSAASSAVGSISSAASAFSSAAGAAASVQVPVSAPVVVAAAAGGAIHGPGTSTSDSVPAMLSDGEYVIKASSAAKYGTHFLDALNAGSLQPTVYRSNGGYVWHQETGSQPGDSKYGFSREYDWWRRQYPGLAQWNDGKIYAWANSGYADPNNIYNYVWNPDTGTQAADAKYGYTTAYDSYRRQYIGLSTSDDAEIYNWANSGYADPSNPNNWVNGGSEYGYRGSNSGAVDADTLAKINLAYEEQRQTLLELYKTLKPMPEVIDELSKAAGFDVSTLSADGIKKYLSDLLEASKPMTDGSFSEEAKNAINQIDLLGGSIGQLIEAAQKRQEWQDRLDVLSGKTTEEALQRQADLASTTDTATLAIIQQIHAQEDAKKVAKENQGWQDKITSLLYPSMQHEMDMQRDLAAATDETTKTLITQYYAQVEQKEAYAQAMELVKAMDTADITLLRAQGREQEAVNLQRSVDIRGMTQAQVVAYDYARAIEKQVAILNERKGLETQLLQAQGDTLALRAKERAALDESNRAIYDQIKALEDEKAVRAAMQTVAQQYKSFVDTVSSTKSTLDAASNGITQGYLNAQDAVASAQQAVQDAITQNGQALLGLAKQIRDFVSGIDQSDAGGLNKVQRFAVAQSDYAIALAQAKAGDKDAMGKLTNLAGSLLNLGKDVSVTSVDYRTLVAQTKASLGDLAKATEAQNASAQSSTDPVAAAQDKLAKAQADLALWNQAIAESGASTQKQVTDYAADWRKANQAYLKALGDKSLADQLVEGLDTTLKTPLQDLADAVNNVSQALELLRSTSAGAATTTARTTTTAGTTTTSSGSGAGGSTFTYATATGTPSSWAADTGLAQGTAGSAAALAQSATSPYGTAWGGNAGYFNGHDISDLPVNINVLTGSTGNDNGLGNVDMLYGAAKSLGLDSADIAKAYSDIGYNITQAEILQRAQEQGIPAFSVGTNYVPRNMLAVLHEGEAVQPKAYNPAAGGSAQNTERLERLVEVLTAEVQRLQALQRDNNVHTRRTADAVNGTPEAPLLTKAV